LIKKQRLVRVPGAATLNRKDLHEIDPIIFSIDRDLMNSQSGPIWATKADLGTQPGEIPVKITRAIVAMVQNNGGFFRLESSPSVPTSPQEVDAFFLLGAGQTKYVLT